MSDPTYQRVGPAQEAASMGELVWDGDDDGPDPDAQDHFRTSPVSMGSRVEPEVSEVLRRFPRPGKNAPVRGSTGPLSTRSLTGVAMAMGIVLCVIGAWMALG